MGANGAVLMTDHPSFHRVNNYVFDSGSGEWVPMEQPPTYDVSGNLVISNGKAIQTDTTNAHTALIQAYDVDGAAYKTFGTLTNANTPSFALSAPSGGTLSGDFTTLAIAGKAITSGVYTPTRSAESNLDSNVTMTEAQYLRVANTVTVSGRFTADPTAGGAASFEITLPVASNIGAAEDVAGVAFSGGIAGQGAEIIGVAANDTAKVQWIAVDTTSKTWSYTFSYQVI